MACRGCTNLQCNCFTAASDSTDTFGNGTQYAPFSFRPNYIPTPRPFGHLYGETNQNLDGAAYSAMVTNTGDLNLGGNMRTENGISLTARADGLHLVGITCPFQTSATADLNDNFSIRKNGGALESTATYAHTTATTGGIVLMMSTVTLLDLNVGDTLDLYVERAAGAGNVVVTAGNGIPSIWAIWMGGPI